jgi:hypothetical protein
MVSGNMGMTSSNGDRGQDDLQDAACRIQHGKEPLVKKIKGRVLFARNGKRH